MGYRKTTTVNINPDFLREAIEASRFTQTDVSRVIGMADNYVSSLLRYGAGDAARVRSIATLLGVPYEKIIQIEAPAEPEPAQKEEPAQLPSVTGQTVRGLYEQLVKQNSRLDDIEKELRRLQSMEMRQDKMCNQIGAMVEMFTRWSDQITKMTTQAASCATTLLRLRALLEGRKD
jgi:transcriptional regulator with XRE-family HTH domain